MQGYPQWIAAVRVRHVRCDEFGVLLAVPGTRGRMVPVLAEWEEWVAEAADGLAQDRPLFAPGHKGTPRNLITNFLAKCGNSYERPQSQRLRATWIVTHLAARTPVVPFMAAAGVESLEALTRYLRFVPGTDLVEARRLLRRALTTPVLTDAGR